MSYDTEVVKIGRLSNGWTVDVYDPSPSEEKADKKAAKGMISEVPYRDPWRSMAFGTFDEVLKFLSKKGANLKPRNFDDDYAKSFDATVAAMKKPTKEKAK